MKEMIPYLIILFILPIKTGNRLSEVLLKKFSFFTYIFMLY